MTMATTITINVSNNSPTQQSFFFFQQPAQYRGGAQVYTNSLFTAPLPPIHASGAVLSFTMMLQYYAGVQQQIAPPVVGEPSGQPVASQAIGLTPAPGGQPTANTTAMSVSPTLELSAPVSTVGPPPGSFRIVTPTYNSSHVAYNAGSALQTSQAGVTLANFITAKPNINLDCQPVNKFYVGTGIYTAGTVIDFTRSATYAALCDATTDGSSFNVSYNANGTWTVQNLAMA
jgi:hypothetical protein